MRSAQSAPARLSARQPAIVSVALLAACALLASCSGGSGSGTEPRLNTAGGREQQSYEGPAAVNERVQSFRLEVWDKLAGADRCGNCHGTGGQVPRFVRSDDINEAHREALGVVDLSQPGRSRLVTKVGGGHNCWVSSPAVCADIVAQYVANWGQGAGVSATRTVQLEAPTERQVGASKTFPESEFAFTATVYPLLRDYCVDCHSPDAPSPQQPYLASASATESYQAARSRIDLDLPIVSRLVQRLADEYHNCWSDCPDDAEAMRLAIADFADAIPLTEVDESLVASKALYLAQDGIVASAGGRHESHLIAKYEFKTGAGDTAYDSSGTRPELHLSLIGSTEWVGGWGVRFIDGRAQGSVEASRKLYQKIAATGEYSIEAWVAPGNVTQEGPAPIVSYAGSDAARNFTLGQAQYNYVFLNRSTATSANGDPGLATADDAERLQATLQHVVATFDPLSGRRLYVNGEFTEDLDEAGGGTLVDWNDGFALVLGSEVSGRRQWSGVLRMVAIHNRALSPAQVADNFEVGVGQKFFLLFGVEEQTGIPGSYIQFEVSQFDSYSYLFNRPRFISLKHPGAFAELPLQGMRIGINGREALVGQAWGGLDTALRADRYGSEGQLLSEQGTIIALEKGPESDEFFLSFDQLGSRSHVRLAPAEPPPSDPPVNLRAPSIGLRTFAEINATLSRLTGVPVTGTKVVATYQRVIQQLPTVENIEGFLSAQQMAVTQLTIEYCNALVEDAARRAAFFPGFDFEPASPLGLPPGGADRDRILDPLLAAVIYGIPLADPLEAPARAELESLISRLGCDGGCANARRAVIVKASCAAALGSAGMLIQ